MVRKLSRRHGVSTRMAMRYVDEAVRGALPPGVAIGVVRIGATLDNDAPLHIAVSIDRRTGRIVDHHLDDPANSLAKAVSMVEEHRPEQGAVHAHHSIDVEKTRAGQEVDRLSGRPGTAITRIMGKLIDTLPLRPNGTGHPADDIGFTGIDQARSYVGHAVAMHNARLDPEV